MTWLPITPVNGHRRISEVADDPRNADVLNSAWGKPAWRATNQPRAFPVNLTADVPSSGYARDMSTRDILAHVDEMYQREVCPSLINEVTERQWDTHSVRQLQLDI